MLDLKSLLAYEHHPECPRPYVRADGRPDLHLSFDVDAGLRELLLEMFTVFHAVGIERVCREAGVNLQFVQVLQHLGDGLVLAQGLAKERDLSLLADGDDGLDVGQLSDGGRRLADAPAAGEVLQRVEGRVNLDL